MSDRIPLNLSLSSSSSSPSEENNDDTFESSSVLNVSCSSFEFYFFSWKSKGIAESQDFYKMRVLSYFTRRELLRN